MLPEVHLKALVRKLLHELSWFRETSGFPSKTARIRVGLPSWLEANHVTGYLSIAKLTGKFLDAHAIAVLLCAVPEAKSPFRRHKSATGEQVIALNDLSHRRTRKEIHIHSLCPRYLDRYLAWILECQSASRLGSVHRT